MLDETIITETPPLYCCYGRIGQQVCVPITGNRRRRIIHGAINIDSGDLLLLISEIWDALTHQYFLGMIRSHWRGWYITLFEDRGSPHTVEDSQELAAELDIHLRFLPKACPELNAMDQLFRFVKSQGVANRPTLTIDQSADAACNYLYEMSRRERLVKAGVQSDNFWLAER
jgi:transposase